jgi:hypothetical protein
VSKIKVIKKAERDIPVTPPEAEATAKPGEWTTVVKSWVNEFQADRVEESSAAFDSLFEE